MKKFDRRLMAISLLTFVVLMGCGKGGGQKIRTYPAGETLRVDDYRSDGSLSKSVWYLPSGTVTLQTDWTRNGEGFEYSLYPDGSVQMKLTTKNYLAHGTAWTYDEDGKCIATVEYSNGVMLR